LTVGLREKTIFDGLTPTPPEHLLLNGQTRHPQGDQYEMGTIFK